MAMQRLTVVFILLSLASFGTASRAIAQTNPSPESLQAAKELASVFSSQLIAQSVTSASSLVWPKLEAALRTQNNKIDAATLAELRKEFESLMTASYNDVLNDAPAVYAKYFTAQELHDLAAFYRTPLGAKSLQSMPQIMADLNAKTAARLQAAQEKVYLAFLNILQKRGLYAQ